MDAAQTPATNKTAQTWQRTGRRIKTVPEKAEPYLVQSACQQAMRLT